MQKLYRAVNHPGFGVCCHISGFQGTKEEVDIADREIAPWVVHTHIDWDVCNGPLVEKMNNLRNAGYQGYYSVEHHSARTNTPRSPFSSPRSAPSCKAGARAARAWTPITKSGADQPPT